MFDTILIPFFIVACCMLAGFFLEKIVLPRLSVIVKASSNLIDDIFIRSFKGMLMLWSIMAGLYLAAMYAFYDTTWVIYLIKIIVSLGILTVSLVVSRFGSGLVKIYSRKVEGVLPSTSMFANLTKLFIFVLGFLILLQYLGISITPILTALGVGGLAVALALQDTLSNIFAGLQILLSRQLKIGDYIRLDSGEEGYIEDISWRNTSIRMMSNSMILIPNSKLSGVTVINHDLPGKDVSVAIKVGVSYHSDLEFVEGVASQIAQDVMKQVPGGIPDYQPAVRFHSFSDYSIDFNVVLRAKSYSDQYIVRHEFIKRLHKRFIELGIDIPSPINRMSS
ncbi:MAG: mechanosensitive ion channel family protein [Clostridia bacterium]|nr:mechanosensitive ion channel family protein [Clostridia bacterium]